MTADGPPCARRLALSIFVKRHDTRTLYSTARFAPALLISFSQGFPAGGIASA